MPDDYYNSRFDRLESLVDDRTRQIPEVMERVRSQHDDISDLKAELRTHKAEISTIKLTMTEQIAKCPKPELDQFKRWLWGIVASIVLLMFSVFYRGGK